MNWFYKLTNPRKDLDDLLISFRKQKSELLAQRKCLIDFLNISLSSFTQQLENIFNNKNLVFINSKEALGLHYFIDKFAQTYATNHQSEYVYIQVNKVFKRAEILALLIIKELKQKSSSDLLAQVKKTTKNKNLIIIIDQLSNALPDDELHLLLNYLQNAKVIVIFNTKHITKPENINNDKEIETLQITSFSEGQCLDLSLNLLNYRSDLLLKTADRAELLTLANYCKYSPEIILAMLGGLEGENNLFIQKYLENIKKQNKNLPTQNPLENKTYEIYLPLAYIIKHLPNIIKSILKTIYYLPSSGFSLHDLYIIINNTSNYEISKEDLKDILQYLICFLGLQIHPKQSPEDDNLIYYLPEYIKYFIKSNLLIDTNNNILENEINTLLLKRLESNSLWKEDIVWISQLEQSFISLELILQKQSFEKNRNCILFLHLIFQELGLWKYCQDTLIPLCKQAIELCHNIEDRGFWYSLLGLIHHNIANNTHTISELHLALSSFEKALKFYDKQKQVHYYKFVCQSIGFIYYDMASFQQIIEDKIFYYKEALKFHYKMLSNHEPDYKSKKIIAHTFETLAKVNNNYDSFHKALEFYLQSFNEAPDNQKHLLKSKIDNLIDYINDLNLSDEEREKFKSVNSKLALHQTDIKY